MPNNLPAQGDYLTINEAAKVLKVSSKTLRRWDAKNLLHPVRTEGGHRRYALTDLVELKHSKKKIKNLHKIVLHQENQFKEDKVVTPVKDWLIPDPIVNKSRRFNLSRKSIFTFAGTSILFFAAFVAVRAQFGNIFKQNDLGESLNAVRPEVLADKISLQDVVFKINVPSTFNEDVAVNADASVAGNLTVEGADNAIAGTLTLTGNRLASSGDLTIAPTGGGVRIGTTGTPTIDLANGDLFVSNQVEIGSSLSLNGDSISDFTGTGLQLVNGSLTATLGTTIEGSEISDDTIEEVSLKVSNDPTNGQVLTYDSDTGAFTWADDATGDTSPWDQGTDVVTLKTTTDSVNIGGTTDIAKLGVQGDSDEIQLLVVGNSTQTSNLFAVQNSSNTNLFTVDNSGNATVSTGDVVIGAIGLNDPGSSNANSGATLIGVYDEFTNSSATTLQAVLKDFDSAMGAGSSKWTDTGPLTYLTSTTDDVAVGGSTLASPFSVDVSANAVRIGTGATANAVISLYASDADTGSLTYNTSDQFDFSGGDVRVEGQLITGSTPVTLTTTTGYLDADALQLISGDGTGGTSSGSGLETDSDRLGLLQGCSDQEILKWDEASQVWACSNDAGSGGTAVVNVQNNDVSVGASVDTLDFSTDFTVTASPSNEANISIADDILNFSEFSDSLVLDASTAITAGSALNLTIGNNVTLTTSGTGSIVATDVVCTDCITLATETSGNYVATVTGNSQIGVSGSGSENAGVSLSITANSIAETQLAAAITFSDGDFLDFSAINNSSTTEGIKLPQNTSCASGTAEGQICWDTDGDFLVMGTGSGVVNILSSSSSLFTAAGDSGSNQTISTGDTLTIAGGTNGIDTVGTATDIVTLNLDTTEIGSTTFGSGSAVTWTFDASAGTDTTVAFGNNTQTFTTGTATFTGDVAVQGGDITLNTAGTIVPSGAGTITIGNSSLQSLTVTTDGTGDAELTVPGNSISNSELVNSSITFAGDSGSSSTSLGGTRTVAGGTNGVDTSESAGTVTINLDATEIGTTTFGSGSAFTWTFDASSGTDTTLAFGNNSGTFTGNTFIVASSTTNADSIAIIPQNSTATNSFTGTITSADLTAARTWTFPDDTGTVCLTTGNCAGTTNYWQLNTGNIAPGNAASVTDRLVLGGNTTTPFQLEVNGKQTGKALVSFNETGDQNILTASASGTTVANLDRSGNLTIEGALADLSGATLSVNDSLDVNGTSGLTLSGSGADLIFANGERLTNDTNGQFNFGRNDAGTVTLTANDDDATAALTILPGGAAALTLGGSSATSITLTTDSTGDGELTVPGSSISNTELVNSSITFAGDSGSSATSLGGTRTIAGGTNGVDTSESGGTLTINLDTTEIGTTSFGSGSAFTWTFDASGGVDTTLVFGNNIGTFNANTFTVTSPTTNADSISLVPQSSTATNSFTGTVTSADLTAARTWTFPDDTGTVCLTTGNCAGSGGGITGSGTSGQVTFFNGSGTITSEASGFAWDATNNKLGIGTDSPTSKLHLTGAVTGKALAIFDETGDQNIFTASASGTTVATIDRNGQLTVNRTTANADKIALIGNSTGSNTFTGSFTPADLTADRTWTLPDATGTVCLTTGNCAGVGGVGTMSTWTIAGDSGSDAVTDSQTVTIAGGTNGIDTSESGRTVTLNLDTTEIGNTTFGSGSDFTWTFNGSGSTDPTIVFGSNSITTSGLTTLTRTLAADAATTQNVASVTFSSPADTTGTNVNQGLNITPTIGNATGGTNTANIFNIGAVSGDAQVTVNAIKIGDLTGTGATETAINVGSNWDSALTIAGTSIINGSGVLQSAGLSGTYSNALTLSSTSNALTGTIGQATPLAGSFTNLSSTGLTTIGNNSTTVAIDSSDWDISTAGAMTGISGISNDGAYTQSGSNTNTLTGVTSETAVNAAGGSANALTLSGTLGIFDGSDTFRGLYLNYTNADHTGSTNVFNGIDIAGITGDAQATETALNIGSGWDTALVTNNGNINAGSGAITAASIAPSGAAAFTIGGASTTAITLTTDSTGDAEVVLPTGSISSTEILDDTITTSDLAATLTFSDGDFLDLSSINTSSTTEGLKLPQNATACSSGTAEGQICWDSSTDTLYIGNGATASAIGGGTSFTSFTAAGDSGGGQTITNGNTLTIAGGTNGIDTVDSATDKVTINLDTTEIGTTTFGSGSAIVWTFDASGGTDPTFTFGSDSVNITAGTTTATGGLTVTGTTALNGIANIGDAGDAIALSGTTVGITSNSGSNDITLTSADDILFTPADEITATFATDSQFAIDASTTANTTTGGVFDLNVNAGNAAVIGSNIDFIQNTGASTGTDAIAQKINLTANDADGDVFGLQISAAATANAGAGSYESLLTLSNAENTAGAVTDALLITTSSGTAGDITDAIDASASDITNALNVGANFILGDGIRQFSSSSTVWTFEDTAGNDLLTITDGGTTGDLVSTNTLSAYGTSIGLNNDASANNVLSFGTGPGAATGDLYWGDKLLCTAATSNCGWATTGSSVTGSGNANQVAYWSSTSAITGSTFFTADPTTDTGNSFALANTGLTTGKLLLFSGTNAASTNTAITQDAFNITNNQSSVANTAGIVGVGITYTNNPAIAGNTEYAAKIANALTLNTTDNATAALLLLDNADTSGTGSTVVTDAIRITNSGGISAGITNGIAFRDTTIDTGINFVSTPTTNYVAGTNWTITGAGAETLGSNLTVNGTTGITLGGSGADLIFANSERITNDSDAQFNFGRNDAGTVTLTANDDDSTAALTILPGGAAAFTLGGSSTTAITLTTDGTGTAEVVLPTGSIDSTEILDNTITTSDLNATLTFSDGDLVDLSSINQSANTEGLKLPQNATACSSGTAEGQICWDSSTDTLYVGNGSTASAIGGGSSFTSFTAAGDSGGGQTISSGNTLSIFGGTNGVDTVDSATDTVTINLDTTEIGTTTFGSGSGIVWTFDASAGTDTTVTFGNDTVNITAGTTTATGALTVTGTTTLNGIANIGDGGDAIALSGTTVGITSNSGSNDITLTSADDILFTPSDDMTLTFAAGSQFVIDASTTANTTTGGVIDLNVNAGDAAVIANNIDLIQNNGATAGRDAIAEKINLTANDGDGDVFGLQISSAATTNAGAGSYESLLTLSNAEDTAGVVPDALLITTTSGTAGDITDAIDASASDITNALNIGANFILGDGIRQFSSSSTVWTFEDTSGNDLFTVTDAGSTGNIATTGDLTVSGNDITFGNAETISNATDNVLALGGTSDSVVLRLPVKSTTGDSGLDTTEGNIYYNANDDKFRCYQGAAWTDCISAGGFTSFTAAGDSGGGQTISNSNTLTIAGGTNGIDTVDSATDTVTLNLDTTEIGSVTFNAGASDPVWTVNTSGATDPTLTFANSSIQFGSAATLVSDQSTLNLFNSTSSTINAFSAATTLNLADAAITGTVDIGGVTSDGASTINIATNATSADTITIGNSHASTTVAITGGDDYSLAATGVLTLSASASQTTAIVATDTDYTNFASIGDNNLLGTTAAIDFSNFDVATTGNITTATGTGLDCNAGSCNLKLGVTNATTIDVGTTAATAINIGAGGSLTRAIAIGTGTGADTITIGTGGTGADTITVGNNASSTALNLTSGTGSQTFTSSVASTSTTSSAWVFSDTALNSGTGLYLTGSALTTGKLAQFAPTGNTQTTGTILDLSSSATSITTGASIANGGAAVGSMLDVSLTGNSAFTGNLSTFDFSPTSATTATGDILHINVGTNGNVGNLLNITDGGTSLFSVSETAITSALPHNFTAPGDVNMAYDLVLTNQTASFIKSNAPLTIDTGEVFESNNLTLRTYNSGNIIADLGTTAGKMSIGANINPVGLLTVSNLNTTTMGKALAMFDQDESQAVLTASASGTTIMTLTGGTTGDLIIGADGVNTAANIGGNGLLVYGAVCVDDSLDNADDCIDASRAAGSINSITFATSIDDLAENFPTEDSSLEGADIVSLDYNAVPEGVNPDDYETEFVKKSVSSDGTNVLGVISAKPGGLLGGWGQKLDPRSVKEVAVALSGRIPVKVTSQNGNIAPGDFITLSSIPGVGVKSTNPADSIVGKALDKYENSDTNAVGSVLVFVNTQWERNTQTAGDTTDLNDRLTALENDFNLKVNSSLTATDSGILANFSDVKSNTLSVLGDTVLSNTVINGTLNIGAMTFDNVDQSINAVGTLKIQSLALGNIELQGGLVTIDTTGNVVVNTITAQKYQVAGSSAGTSTLFAGTTEISITTPSVTANSLIFVTPKSAVNSALAVTTKVEGDHFIVSTLTPNINDVDFDWFIVDKQ